LLRRGYRRFHWRFRLAWFYGRDSPRSHLWHYRWVRFHPHEFEMLRPRPKPIGAAAASPRWSLASSTNYVRSRKIRRPDDGPQNEKKDQCVQKQRRNDPFPSFFLLLPLREGGIARSYFTSFGVAAITLTPAPRATSIAMITSEYFTAGSPFTKMILSGRGS
jgi:hypothetical protein